MMATATATATANEQRQSLWQFVSKNGFRLALSLGTFVVCVWFGRDNDNGDNIHSHERRRLSGSFIDPRTVELRPPGPGPPLPQQGVAVDDGFISCQVANIMGVDDDVDVDPSLIPCPPVKDYLLSLASQPPRQPNKKRLHFTFVGDSLDRNMVTFAADKLNLEMKNKGGIETEQVMHKIQMYNQPIPTSEDLKLAPSRYIDINYGESRDVNDAYYTDRQSITLSHFTIFGMNAQCPNGSTAGKEDSRFDEKENTAQRIQHFFAKDLNYASSQAFPDLLKKREDQEQFQQEELLIAQQSNDEEFIAMVGSCLWDLSQGCNNNPKMDQDYLQNYAQGIRDNYSTLKNTLGIKYIFWRTCPPITESYSERTIRGVHGRTRTNQEKLNQVLREVVENEHLGIVVDWWRLIEENNVPEKMINMPDGRHYPPGPSVAFLNVYLETVFGHYPELL